MPQAPYLFKIGLLIVFFTVLAIPAEAAALATGNVTCLVTASDGQVVPYASVEIRDSENGFLYAIANANENGYCEFSGVAATGYGGGIFQARADASVEGVDYAGYSDPFTLESGATVNIQVTIPQLIVTEPSPTPTPTYSPATGNITCRITTSDGRDIPYALVEIVDSEDGFLYAIANADENGYCEFSGVAATGYGASCFRARAGLNIEGTNYEGYSDPFTLETGTTADVHVTLPLSAPIPIPESFPATGNITCRITTSDGQSLPRALVEIVDSENGFLYAAAYTDEDGYFEFGGVAATGYGGGIFRARASKGIEDALYEGYSDPFTLESGATVNIQVTVTKPSRTPGATTEPLIGAGGISGRITFANGTGAANATVIVVDAAYYSRIYYTGRTDSEGFYQFTEVRNTWDDNLKTYGCRYILFAGASVDDGIFEGWSAPFGVEPGSTAEVDTQVYPLGINTEPWKPLGIAWNETFMIELPVTSVPGIVPVTDNPGPNPTMPAMVNITGPVLAQQDGEGPNPPVAGKTEAVVAAVTVAGAATVTMTAIAIKFLLAGTIARARSLLDVNKNRKRVLKCIAGNPGVTMSELSKYMGMNMGTVRYHLLVLEQNYRVKIYEDGKFIRYFPNSTFFRQEDQLIISLMRRESLRDIVLSLIQSPGQTNSELSDTLSLSESAISGQLKLLCEQEVTTREKSPDGRILFEVSDDAMATIARLRERMAEKDVRFWQ